MKRFTTGLATIALILVLWPATKARALDDSHWDLADRAIDRGITYLRTTQNADGSWTPQPGPAITAMVLTLMLDRPGLATNDPAIKNAIAYVLSKRHDDGGIHDGILENYNTAICLAALSRINDQAGVAETINKAQDFLIGLQWRNQADPHGQPIGQDHPYYGGAGYGNHGRPDMSNTQIMLEGLYQSGFDCNDPVFQRALIFITRCQGTRSNTQFGDKIVQDGGFIYATSIDKEHIGVPQSMASPDMIDHAKSGGPVSGLRTYGSMTYAGFKSYIYANLDRHDQRVVDAYRWIGQHYTLKHNPGMPESQKMQGYYYYLMTFSKALDAWGSDRITTADGTSHDWANDVVAELVTRQHKNGSWANDADRWMEGDPNLTTAYALTALTHAVK